ncbi:MAG: GTPase Era [Bacilli bacterium]|nr:GTPase Era [Bacilli bacterium]
MRSGFVAILGRPNVGKSTLVNAMLSKKVSIVSPKAQTTRDAVLGILTEADTQIVFLDTPGIYFGKEKLDSHMRRSAFSSSREVDAIVYLLDAGDIDLARDFKIIDSIHSEAPIFFVLNKIDLIDPETGKKILGQIRDKYPTRPIIEASLKNNFGLKEIKAAVIPTLSGEAPFYPEDWLTDRNLDYQAKEIIREKMLYFLDKEVPHSSAVKITSFKVVKDALSIEALVVVDRESHKAIVIGKGGAMIKKISMAARQEMEKRWHRRVSSLVLKVEARPGWRSRVKDLVELGYGDTGE